MSTETVTYTSEQVSEQAVSSGTSVRYDSAPSFVPFDAASLRVFPTTSRQGRADVKFKPRVVRRLKGFLIEQLGTEARVAFVENGDKFEYYLPFDRLRKAKVTLENQPFEMDEVEFASEDGGFFTGYEIRSLAKTSDSFADTFSLDQEREKKRDIIFKKFTNAQV